MTEVIVRFSKEIWDELRAHLFLRYPDHEWATWINFGWRANGGSLILSAVSLDLPKSGELDESVGHVAIQEPYSLRIALQAERHPFAVGVAHSHPKECFPVASHIDDDMDNYYSDFLNGFTKRRPYPSLILSDVGNTVVCSGRVWWQERWQPVTRVVAEGSFVPIWINRARATQKPILEDRVARLAASFGRHAAERLRNARVAVVGAGGTGAPAIEVLARAGVGHITAVDPDTIDNSNLERIHGAYPQDVVNNRSKIAVARDHVRLIDPDICFEGYVGRVPQPTIVDALTRCDVVLGCTDQQSSRLALSEIAYRYLVPVIDVGVALEGSSGHISAQIIQLLQLTTTSPCVICRGMVDWARIAQELMSPDERLQRRAAADEARQRGDNAHGYWKDLPQLNTVGYITTAAGALGAGCAIGFVTGSFAPGFERSQFTLFSATPELLTWSEAASAGCVCQQRRGYGDLAPEDRLISCPLHWAAPSSD
jgi:tRNA A37 threonylcarbamoyladenosine dehydratase